MIRRLLLSAAALLALSGCESSPTSINSAPEGTLQFTYTGDATGSFDATGRFNRMNPNFGTWAVGTRATVSSGPVLAVFAQDQVTFNMFNVTVLEVADPEIGTFTCTIENPGACKLSILFLVNAPANGTEPEAIYGLSGGTVTITALTSSRAIGTFQVELTDFQTLEDPSTIQASGTFTVPLVDADDIV